MEDKMQLTEEYLTNKFEGYRNNSCTRIEVHHILRDYKATLAVTPPEGLMEELVVTESNRDIYLLDEQERAAAMLKHIPTFISHAKCELSQETLELYEHDILCFEQHNKSVDAILSKLAPIIEAKVSEVRREVVKDITAYWIAREKDDAGYLKKLVDKIPEFRDFFIEEAHAKAYNAALAKWPLINPADVVEAVEAAKQAERERRP